jgi:acyl-CoA synthetase (AMP-forming)/AMP-acid ligase II
MLDDIEFVIQDPVSKKILSSNEIGEILIKGYNTCNGYYKIPDEKQPFDDEGYLHTGDLGYIDEDGFLFIVGRMKRMILTTKGGIAYKVFPNMAEEILESHTSVVQSCIVGANDGDDQVLRAHIMVSKEDISKNVEIEKELRKICEGKLPSYSRPTFYCFSDSLPLTAAGKVDYRELEKRDVN